MLGFGRNNGQNQTNPQLNGNKEVLHDQTRFLVQMYQIQAKNPGLRGKITNDDNLSTPTNFFDP